MSIAGIKNEHVANRLATDLIMWLGTVKPDGRPHMVPVWFDWAGEHVTIFSEPDTQKIRNIRHESRVVLAIDDSRGGGDVLVFEGDAELPLEPAKDVVTPAYFEKYREGLQNLSLTGDQMVTRYSQVIRIRLTRFMGH
jgi:PPOX class probable F420-dependent enzyme